MPGVGGKGTSDCVGGGGASPPSDHRPGKVIDLDVDGYRSPSSTPVGFSSCEDAADERHELESGTHQSTALQRNVTLP